MLSEFKCRPGRSKLSKTRRRFPAEYHRGVMNTDTGAYSGMNVARHVTP